MKLFSLINKIKDYLNFDEFRDSRMLLESMLKKQSNLDYGSGYFYQSFNKLKSQVLDTVSRINNYNIKNYIQGPNTF